MSLLLECRSVGLRVQTVRDGETHREELAGVLCWRSHDRPPRCLDRCPAHQPRPARGGGQRGVARGPDPSRAAPRSGRSPRCCRTSAAAAEIAYARLAPAIAGEPVPDIDNQAVWDRWNAMSPEEQAAGFLQKHDELFAGPGGARRRAAQDAHVDLGFLPEPRTARRPSSACASTRPRHTPGTSGSRSTPTPASSRPRPASWSSTSPTASASCSTSPQGRITGASRRRWPWTATASRSPTPSALTVGTPEDPTATFNGPLEAACGCQRPPAARGHTGRRRGHRQRDPGRPAAGLPGLLGQPARRAPAVRAGRPRGSG